MDDIVRGKDEPTSTPGTSVPKDIADRILSSRSSLEGERKQVTVLFCDVAGFTPLAERLDPEEVRDLIRPALDIMASEVHAYEGTVAQFTGDGIMALFGAPVAFEDAPVRAVRAAIEMQQRLSAYSGELASKEISFEVRIGINTGLVIVGSIGDDLSMEYTALGDTVNLASRMESAAEPGTVQVAENTYRLTKGYFDFQDLGEIAIKGKKQPAHAYRVLDVLPNAGRIAASISPFVGRERELDSLTYSYNQAKAGQGQVVGMVGEPGVGKSRLLLQFRERLPQEEYTYLEGGCIHYGEAIAYLPMQGILRDYFDISEGEEDDVSKRKMDQRLASLNGQLVHILPPLQELLSLEVDDQSYFSLEPAQRRERVFEAIRYLFMVESQQRPLILAIEDLHWIDRTSEEFLSYFIEGLPGANILLILLYRPEYTPAWASKPFYRQILVDQLPQESSTELVEAILSGGEVSPDISDFVVAKTAGNPLFIEELTRGLLEAGSILKDNEHYVLSGKPSDILVPDTIQGIIASRLDRLSEDIKETLQVASVIGREFSLRLLETVTGLGKVLKSNLLQLQSLEFIYEKSLFPEPVYIFKHALTQDVAYNSLLLKLRKEIHETIGRAIEGLYPDTLEDFYESLAYHYSRSEDVENAVTYLKLSGDKSMRNFSLWEAIRFYKEAIPMLDSQVDSIEEKRKKLEVYLAIQAPLMFLSFPEGSLEILQEAERLAEELGDDGSLAAVYGKLSRYYSFMRDLSLGVVYFEKCFDTAERIGDVESMATIAMDFGPALIVGAGRIKEMAEISRRVLELLEEQHKEKDLFAGGRTVFVYQSGWYTLALTGLGEFEKGRSVSEKGLRVALEVGDTYGAGWVECWWSLLSYWRGDTEGVIDHARRAIECWEEIGVEYLLGTVWSYSGIGHCFLGDHETARAHAEKGLEMTRQSGIPSMVPYCCYFLAMIRLGAGELEGARESAGEAFRLSQEFGSITLEAWALLALGRILGEADREQVKLAEDNIRQGISMAEGIKGKPISAQGYLFLGEVFEIAERRKEALENLMKAEQMYLDMGVCPDSYWLARTREALARLEPVS